MQQHKHLFDISRSVWQSFSSQSLVEVNDSLEANSTLLLQWFYCHLSSSQVVMLGIDQSAGYQLAADMLHSSIDALSEEDEQDAMIELMNCICGVLDRDHPTDECFGLPKLLEPSGIQTLLSSLNKVSEVTANAGNKWFYIALFEDNNIEKYGAIK
jgi:hypothetical protein